MRKNAIVIGASSGIGRELAKQLSQKGYAVGLAARRLELLGEVRKEIQGPSLGRQMDVSRLPEATDRLQGLIREMGGVDLVVVSAGTGFLNPGLNWKEEKETIDVNVTGFAAAANVAMKHFLEQGSGHLVGISSLAALRGGRDAPAYNASKAFVSNYLEGLRQKVGKKRLPITVTDIQPGFVETAMAQGEAKFWVAAPEKAARQIVKAIEKKRNHAYVTRRWRLIAWLLKAIPRAVYSRL